MHALGMCRQATAQVQLHFISDTKYPVSMFTLILEQQVWSLGTYNGSILHGLWILGKLSGSSVALSERGPTAAEKRLKQLAELLDRLG